jgi:hypothetical protein
MRPAQRLAFIFLFGSFISLTACVSVNLNKSAPTVRDDNVKFDAPVKPFTAIKSEDIDQGWRNPENGNSISFVTECTKGIDPSLENIHAGIIKGVNDAEIVSKDKISYNGREGLRSVVTGKVDGVASKLDFLIFKKNGCIFVLSYVALATSFEQNAGDFQKFINGFKAP